MRRRVVRYGGIAVHGYPALEPQGGVVAVVMVPAASVRETMRSLTLYPNHVVMPVVATVSTSASVASCVKLPIAGF